MSDKAVNAKQSDHAMRGRQAAEPAGHEVTLQHGRAVWPSLGAQRALRDPGRASPADILALQRLAGNAGVSGRIQARLMVGPANDRYEQEADRMADQVLRMPAPVAQGPAGAMGAVQRQAEEEEEIQAKPLAASITPLVQRQAEDEEELQAKLLVQREAEDEEDLQAKLLVQRQAEEEEEVQAKRAAHDFSGSFEAGRHVESRLAANRGGGRPLPAEVRAYMEPRFGADFRGVRLHTGDEATRLNKALQSRAFTHGSDIYLRRADDDLTTPSGRHLLAHELTHTLQQGAARRTEHAAGNRAVSRQVEAGREPPAADAPAVQRYKTSAGWFSNKVKFESSGFNATLAEALRVEKDAAGLRIGSQDYRAVGTVRATGPAARVGRYEVGFLQTVYDSRRSFYYSPDKKPGLGTRLLPALFSKRFCRTNSCSKLPVRDGDAGIKPWYEQNDVAKLDAAADSTKSTDIFDRPSSPGDWKKTVNGQDQYLVKTGGRDSFRTWLVVRNSVTGKILRLNYVDWRVNFGAKVAVNKASPAASVVTPANGAGGKITAREEGPGFYSPYLDDPVANDVAQDVESVW